ncbi:MULTISPECIES: nuclear transport factor 2 family protein [unclassified Microbacterium]|uniref:nuclear transport factor 2 family protein n=1 Tax=unclassified Microbacterium TaxID=2609290 RepID=UPI0030176E05
MTTSTTQNWLDGYLRAWRTKDDADVRALFTDDAEYLFHPYETSPARGIDAVLTAWQDPEPTEAVADLHVLIEGDDIGIIRGTVDYPGHASYVNLWEVHFAADGRARRFVEWYLRVPDAAAE